MNNQVTPQASPQQQPKVTSTNRSFSDASETSSICLNIIPNANNDQAVCVEAIQATTGEHVRIMYSNAKVIGSGSFGMVFIALLEGEHEVAIKKVLQDKRYKNRELQILRELRHPNIVSLIYFFYSVASAPSKENKVMSLEEKTANLSFGENKEDEQEEEDEEIEELEKPKETFLNLVQEYLPQTLSRVIKHYWNLRQLIPMSYVKLYSFQMIRALAYVHSRNICHRDIKPQNLLVNPETGVLKICDFGSTKILVPGEPNVSYICSRYYRAPELIFGATQYTVRIDMWSAGCVIGELLLGRPLFPGDSGVDQLVEIIKVLGTPSLEQVKEMNPQYSKFVFPSIKGCSWEKLINHRSADLAFDLLRSLLVYSPTLRQPSAEALASPFFTDLITAPPGHPASATGHLIDGRPAPRLIDNFSDEELAYLPAHLATSIRQMNAEIQALKSPIPQGQSKTTLDVSNGQNPIPSSSSFAASNIDRPTPPVLRSWSASCQSGALTVAAGLPGSGHDVVGTSSTSNPNTNNNGVGSNRSTSRVSRRISLANDVATLSHRNNIHD